MRRILIHLIRKYPGTVITAEFPCGSDFSGGKFFYQPIFTAHMYFLVQYFPSSVVMGKYYIYTHQAQLSFSRMISGKITSYVLNTIGEIMCRDLENLDKC